MKFATQVPDAAWTIDRIAIQDVVSSISLHSDLREYSEVYQYYSDDAVMDYAALLGEGNGKLPVREQRERIMEFFPGFDTTHHQASNFQITIEGDNATSRSQVRATHWLDGDSWTVAGTYYHKLRRTENGWKVCYHRFDPAYVEGVDLVERARERVKERTASAAE